jgi:hypothetical protein
MELFVMIAVQKQVGMAVRYSHRAETVTVKPGATRINALAWAIAQLPEEMRDGAITFFAAEPNDIGAGRQAAEPEPAPVAV